MDDFIYEDIAVNSERRNLSLGIYMKGRLHASPRVEVYDSDAFGRCLYLDSALQTTEKDEAFYHEPIAHIAMLRCDRPKNVLIIGGGDGGTLREVLKHKCRGLEHVDMVEINPEVIDASKKFLPTFELEKSLSDPIVKLTIADAAKHFENVCGPRYDVIIIDCNDPTSDSSVLYSREFLECTMRPLMNVGAVFAIQAGNAYIKESFVRGVRYELERLFSSVDYYYAPIPSFPSGGIGFLFAMNNPPQISEALRVLSVETKFLNWNTYLAGFKMTPPSLLRNKRAEAFKWHCKNEFEWMEVINPQERECLTAFLKLEDEQNTIDRQHALMGFHHSLMEGSVFASCIDFMTLENVDRIEPQIKGMMKARGDVLPIDAKVNGVSWCVLGSKEWGQIVQYSCILPIIEIEKLYPKLCENKPEICFDEGVVSFMFLNSKHTTTCVTFSDMTKLFVFSQTEKAQTLFPEPHYASYTVDRVRTNLNSWKNRLDKVANEEIDKFTKLGIILRSVGLDKPSLASLYFEVV